METNRNSQTINFITSSENQQTNNNLKIDLTENKTENTQENQYEEIEKFLEEEYILVNKEDIMEFIDKNNGFNEFFKKITPIIRKMYPDNELYLEFLVDPEIEEFNQISLMIKLEKNEDNLDADLDKDHKLNFKIRPYLSEFNLWHKFSAGVIYYEVRL